MRLPWLLVAALLIASPASAQRMMVLGAGGAFTAAAPAGYQGPGDVVASATAWYGLRGYSGAYATPGTGKSVNIRRASDNTTQDIVILTSGAFDTASYNTFVGTDATASCTLAGTAASCSGASATIHVGDPVTGAGITNPCIVTVTNGSTTATMVIAGTASTSCGAIGGAVTFTFQVAGLLPKIYDQSGNTSDLSQATAGLQPQLLPLCLNSATLPCVLPTGTASQELSGTASSIASPQTVELVAERTVVAGFPSVLAYSTGPIGIQYRGTANTIDLYDGGGGDIRVSSATDLVLHSLIGVYNGSSGPIVVDGSATTGTGLAGAATSTTINLFHNGAAYWTGYFANGGWWAGAFNATQYGNMRTNDKAYWNTP